jgi:predicted O-methyltransferase YrrM
VGTPEEVAAGRTFWRDKFVALEPDKAQFCYLLCRALNAARIVEAGTSFGVSTLYLAAAARDNGGGTVISSEWEPEKARIARAHFEQAGLAQYVDLREGDIRDTLRSVEAPVDFLLLDIWTPVARATMELVAPRMRPGAVAIVDNTRKRRVEYSDYFAYVNDPTNGFATVTLPFEGGLELSIKLGHG